MRISILPPAVFAGLTLLMPAGRAMAADKGVDVLAREGAALALDFCGVFIGERPDVTVSGTAQRVPGLSVSEALPLAKLDSDADVRGVLMRLMKLEPEEEVRVASFSAVPSPREFPFAAITADGDLCYIVVPSGDSAVARALDARLGAADSAWRIDEASQGSFMWSRPAPYNEKVLLTYARHSQLTSIVVTLLAREASTAEDLGAQLRGAIAPCVAGVISGKPADTADFKGAFDFYKRLPSEKYPEVQLLDLRATVGPRAWLQVRSMGEHSLCELMTSDQKQPFDKVMEVVNAVISTWPEAKPVELKARDNEPARTAWRVSQKGSRRKADISVTVDHEDIAVVRVERADSGWWR